MLESLVASLLNRFLGSYVENFDPKQLNIGIWSGDVKLKNLRLKKESLDRFKLPLDVKFGHLGQLTLQIPWSNLKSKPVKVFIEDVYLIASPMIPSNYDEEEEKERELALKKHKLEDLEMMAKSLSGDSEEDNTKNMTFTENLVTKIVDNLQVTIKNIHVRYEDESVFTENPYSVGFTLEELSAVSTDESWIPKFISGMTTETKKLLTLSSFEIYWNTELDSIYSDDTDEILLNFKELIESNSHVSSSSTTQYLLKPVSGTGHLTVNKLGATETLPHIKTELFFDEFGIDLDSEQYRDILWTASKYHWFLKTQQFRKFRPKKSPSEAPLAWFKYAAQSVLSEVHDRNHRWTWDHFKTRRDQRVAYIAAFKSKLNGNLSVEDQKELDKLEAELSFEDIRFYRSLAKSQNRKELLELKKSGQLTTTNDQNAVLQQKNQAQSGGGWFGGWWGGAGAKAADSADDGSLQMSEEQRKEFYEAIEYDEQKIIAEAVDIPKDRVKMEVSAVLKRGALAIRKTKGDRNLAEVVFEGCKTQFYQRPESFLACFQLQEFKVEDGTDSTLYKHIVSVEQLHSGVHELQSKEVDLEPFFQVAFENNPLDNSADTSLSAKLRSMTIFHNPKFIENIARFFKPPKIHLDTVGMIMNAAESTLEGLTLQTRIGLQYALEEHKTVNCKLDLQLPLIIIPLDPSDWASPVAVLDAGHISVVSNLADPLVVESLKQSSSYELEDWAKLNELMYDKFDLHLQDAQIFIGSNIKTTIEQLHSNSEKPALILDNLSIKFLLEVSILPTAHDLARFKVGASIERFKAALNDYQYKVFMELIDKAMPNFEFEELDDDVNAASVGFPDWKASNIAGESPQIDEIEPDSRAASPTPDSDLSASTSGNKKSPLTKNSQHLFEFQFNVDVIQLGLSRCVDTTSLKSEPLVELVGSHLHLDFYKTAQDLGVSFVLADISVEDHIVQSVDPEFTRLVSTDVKRLGTESPKKKSDLLQLSYKRTQRIVEFNDKEIEVFDQDVDIDFAAIKFIVTRKSVLTLLNFVLNTFTDPNPVETPADELRHNDADEETAPQKMNVNINLESIVIVLNDDGIKLATLQLSRADINVFMVPEKMKVFMRLGGFTLHDELNEAVPKDSIMRRLISIRGDELAEFTYETFDRSDKSNPFSSAVKFHAGSLKINFVEAPFTQIINFLSKFQQMKGVYDSARLAALDQASSIEDANLISLDLLIQTPIILLPRLRDVTKQEYDIVTVNLGEIYLNNRIETRKGLAVNFVEAGLRNAKIVSDFKFTDNHQQSEIVSDFNVSFGVDYLEKYDPSRATMIITGSIDGSEVVLSEYQASYLIQMLQSVSRVFSSELKDNQSLSELESDAAAANQLLLTNLRLQSPEPSTRTETPRTLEPAAEVIPDDHLKVDFHFDIAKLSLTLYNDTENVADFSERALSRFSLNNTGINLRMKQDGNYKAELQIRSFVVEDIRRVKDNKFTKIIPEIEHDSDQFMASIYSEGKASHRYTYAMLSVDSPKMILALDYLFALKAFSDVAFRPDDSVTVTGTLPGTDKATTAAKSGTNRSSHAVATASNLLAKDASDPGASSFGFTVNIVNSSVILLADPSQEDSEAVVFKVEQLLVTSQNIMSLSSSNVGMFLCKMDQFEDNRLRIIDDFSASLTIDSRGSNATTFLTRIEASVDPLLMRLSLRDIRLAMNIFNRATALYSASVAASSAAETNLEDDDVYTFTKEFRKKLSQYAPTIISNISSTSKLTSGHTLEHPEVLVKGESLLAELQGFRLVLIGDVYELPVLDMNVSPFSIDAQNWSTDLKAGCSVESYVNIFNYATSSWEPLVEPWPVSLNMARTSGEHPAMQLDVTSKQLAELTVSSRSIALMSQISSLLSDEEDLKPRDEITPYRIVNQTGYDVKVWIDSSAEDSKLQATYIAQGDSAPWHFEDWRSVRESLSVDKENGLVGLEFVGSPYEDLQRVSIKGEGEELFLLYPPVEKVHNRLCCEVKLDENKVKTVILRSTITIKNETMVDISFRVDSGAELHIRPGEKNAVPIDSVYSGRFSLKPELHSAYQWSSSSIGWKDVQQGGRVSMVCAPEQASEDHGSAVDFYFEVAAQRDADEPLSKIYPHMSIVISSPIEVENLLPFDISYRIYDKARKKDWKNFLKKGSISPIHVVQLESILLLSLQPVGCGYNKSDFSIINAPLSSGFKPDSRIFLKHDNGQKLHLNLHYTKSQNSGAGVRVTIYTPYLVLNRTGQMLALSEKYNVLRSDNNASYEERDAEGHDVVRTSIPGMFSFEKPDRSNRAVLRVGDSGASNPISLDAIGQTTDITMPVFAKQTEMNVGMEISEGEGKYKLTKVVTFAPRYIVRNCYTEPIYIMEVGSSKETELGVGKSYPLYSLKRVREKQFKVRFGGASGSQWSSPFNVSDIGQVHIKILKPEIGHVLLKVSIILEHSSLFINILDANDQWPFSIRNFSDEEVLFYQSDPSLDENGTPLPAYANAPPFKPIFYRLPPRSVMPYSWDYPLGYIKELIIRSHGRERHIQLHEIGNLRPMRLPATLSRAAAIVDLNVVADGPTQSLVITNYDPSTSMYQLKTQRTSSSSLSLTENFETNETDENYYSKVFVNLEGVGLSLIGHDLQELCYLTVKGIELRYNESDIYQNLSLKLKWIQIDNQLFGSFFPMVLYPSVLPQSTKEMNNHPTFSGSVSRVKDETHGVQYFKFATVLLQEMSVEIDEDFLLAMLEFVKLPGASWNKQISDKLWDETLEIPQPTLLESAEDVYFESLHLQPMQMNLSFVRTDRISDDDKTSSNNPLVFFLNVLTMAIGNINDAPVRLNALFIENIKVPLPILAQMIQAHYGQLFLYQVHKILGSADFIGNPVGLFNNISSGFMDIFYEPYQGFIMNDRPQELGIGIAKGGLSFLKKSVFGFSDSFAKLTGSMAKGLTAATFDKEFQERRRRLNQRRNKPNRAAYSFTDGATSFVDSISSGITGIATAPIEGSKQGAAGFLKGLGKGFVGLPTKTAIGFFDLANNVSEGIRNTTTTFDKGGIDKIRLPRYVAHDHIIRPFSEREAQGQYWLKVIDGGLLFNDTYLAHVVLPGEENVIIISFKYILMCSIVTLESRWKIGYGDIRTISLENTGIKIGVKASSGLRDGPFIPLSDAASRKFLYSRIEIAVREYNKHCQVVL